MAHHACTKFWSSPALRIERAEDAPPADKGPFDEELVGQWKFIRVIPLSIQLSDAGFLVVCF